MKKKLYLQAQKNILGLCFNVNLLISLVFRFIHLTYTISYHVPSLSWATEAQSFQPCDFRLTRDWHRHCYVYGDSVKK